MTVQPFTELCMACRLGDVAKVDKLISAGVNVNDVDEFDYTPLYLASLCGHEEVVKLLLQRGAVCDTDKYEGARCIYGALTDSIRNLLISYDISKAVDTNLPFAAHIRSLLGGVPGAIDLLTEDIVLRLGDHESRLHRFMLAARSEFFKEKLLGVWKGEDVGEVEITDVASADVFSVMTDYIYLVQDPQKFDSVDKAALLDFAKLVGVRGLTDELDKYQRTLDTKERAKLVNEIQMKVFEGAREDFKRLVEDFIIGSKLVLFNDTDKSQITPSQVEKLHNLESFPDIILAVEEPLVVSDESDGETEDEEELPTMTTYYAVHRSVLIRDEYFKVMFSSSFSEAQEYEVNEKLNIIDRSHTIPVVHLPVANSEVAEIVIKHIYYDHSDIPLEHAIDVLYAGELLLNDRLKTMAAVSLTASRQPPPGYSIYDILRAAWETRMERLEHHVAKTIADNLKRFLSDPEFSDIVMESSGRIAVRQETDTIELVDDIRFYLAKKWKIDFNGLFPNENNDFVDQQPGYESYQKELDEIEGLLAELGLEA